MTEIKGWKKFQHFKDRRPPWIKLYRDLLDDPDWHALDGADAKALVMLWLIASEDDGNIPCTRKIAFRLRITETKAEQLLTRLSHWLIQDDITPISDRYQDDTPETEGETYREETDIGAVANATRPADRFLEFWETYPKRDGSNPKEPARKKFATLIKSGVDPGAIIAGACRYAADMRARVQENTPYVAQAVTWLNQQRWGDYSADPPKLVELPGFYAEFGSAQLDAWDRTKPGGYPRDKAGGWRFPTEWPPGWSTITRVNEDAA
jgi:hypothetical protein